MSKILINNQNKVLINDDNKAIAVSGTVRIGINPTRIYAWINTNNAWVHADDSYSVLIPVTKDTTYRLRWTETDSSKVGTIYRYGFTDINSAQGQSLANCLRTTPQDASTVTVTASGDYLVIQISGARGKTIFNNNWLIVEAIV